MQLKTYGKYIDTKSLVSILTQNESNADKPVIALPLSYDLVDLSALTYSIIAINSAGNRIEQTLIKEITSNEVLLTWAISADFTAASGKLEVDLKGVSADVKTVIVFKLGTLQIAQALTGTYAPPPSVIETALSEIHIGVDNARNQAAIAAAQADKAALEASKSASGATAAKTSETNSKSSEIASSQALNDLLAMLGKDIATLVGGKIPAAQIPSIATTEIYQANSLSAMNLLTVQNGDICIRTDENKSYIYNNGWVYLSSPTDYASRAGYADTAANADNSARINNHRMTQMTQAEFDLAVKDSNTYYLVY